MRFPKRRMKTSSRALKAANLLLLILAALPVSPAKAASSRFSVADKMPEFSASDIAGETFTYKHGAGRVVLLTFLSAGQKQSSRANEDLNKILAELPADVNDLDFLAVVDSNSVNSYFGTDNKNSRYGGRFFVDSDRKLWGKFGIIATPTVIIIDKDDKAAWVKPGYGYDFAPAVRSFLNKTLGIAQDINPEDTRIVKTIAKDSVAVRIARHLQMAKLLQNKGQYDSAIREVCKSRQLDPNSVEAALELGRLYCLSGQPQDALETANSIKINDRPIQIQVNLIKGWAKRQIGDLDEAQELLINAVLFPPQASRAYFELGNVYHDKAMYQEAAQAYRKALEIVFKPGK